MSASLERIRSGSILELTLNRPHRRNALDRQLFDALTAAIEEAENDPTIRATIVTGAGSAFCSGYDVDDLTSAGRLDAQVDRSFLNLERSTPLIAAVNGPAVAAGFELVLASDVVVATRSARFSLPEVRLGLVAGGGGVWRLVRAVGRAKALAVTLAGAVITADEALALGLVSSLTADDSLLLEARRLADEIANADPSAVAETLGLARGAFDLSESALWRRGIEASRRAAAAEKRRSLG